MEINKKDMERAMDNIVGAVNAINTNVDVFLADFLSIRTDWHKHSEISIVRGSIDWMADLLHRPVRITAGKQYYTRYILYKGIEIHEIGRLIA